MDRIGGYARDRRNDAASQVGGGSLEVPTLGRNGRRSSRTLRAVRFFNEAGVGDCTAGRRHTGDRTLLGQDESCCGSWSLSSVGAVNENCNSPFPTAGATLAVGGRTFLGRARHRAGTEAALSHDRVEKPTVARGNGQIIPCNRRREGQRDHGLGVEIAVTPRSLWGGFGGLLTGGLGYPFEGDDREGSQARLAPGCVEADRVSGSAGKVDSAASQGSHARVPIRRS